MWKITKVSRFRTKYRYEYEWYDSAYGMVIGYARTRKQAEKRLARAEREMLIG